MYKNLGYSEDQKFLIFFLFAGSTCNPTNLTFDGVDLMGERLADEVLGSGFFILLGINS